ncbi:uncharacterized protein LOC114360479 [Ostrinia furnacalis]|uniref:uncharacterized protein LOC114360479 n=1 Tax=Ostrinia furnacalis TaxID=93504 RepID=UPI001039C2CC|nr:uncharacterized protein LOC114360479 [Ostrinia furnacalis]
MAFHLDIWRLRIDGFANKTGYNSVLQIHLCSLSHDALHAAGALLCAAWAGARGRVAVAVTLGALVAASAANVSSAYADSGQHLPGLYEAYVAIIERPWARVVPYFIGVFTGWMVHRTNGRVSFSKVTASCLWSASASTLLTSALVPWLALDWLAAWVHLTWPLALLWPTLVCSTNYASVARKLLDSGAAAALSRLSYGMLLLHAPVARALVLAAGSALSAHAACVWAYFAGTTLLTIIGALFLSLLVEMPCCSLLRRLSDCATV